MVPSCGEHQVNCESHLEGTSLCGAISVPDHRWPRGFWNTWEFFPSSWRGRTACELCPCVLSGPVSVS